MDTKSRAVAGATILFGVLLAVAAPQLTRPGYSPDEEFTVFAVRGVAATGLPVLPSGLLYDRGVAYSYAAWLASPFGETELAPARAVALASALAALAALWLAASRTAGSLAAWLAVGLVASSVPFWAAATSARFYAPFLAAYLAALAVMARFHGTRKTGHGTRNTGHGTRALLLLLLLVALAALARWTHEIAFTLPVVSALAALLAPRGRRLPWVAATLAILVGLGIAQAALFGLHYLVPASGDTMIRRFFLWQVLNLFARPPAAAPLGVVLVVALVILLVKPTFAQLRWADTGQGLHTWTPRAGLVIVTLALAILAFWAAATSFHRALEYPLDLFWHVARTTPALVAAVLALLVARALGLGGPWTPLQRAAHLLWLGWVVFFGVIESGITIHYVLLPVTLMLAALAIDLAAVVAHHRAAGRVATSGAIVIVLWVAVSHWGWDPATTLDAARPTIVSPSPDALQQAAADAPLVACTDELACLLLAGRVDRWLVLDDYLRERFIVLRQGREVGVYAGRPAVHTLAALFEPLDDGEPPERVLVIDVFKELPIGNSRAFLPRALAAEGLDAAIVVETERLRVVELAAQRPARWAGVRLRWGYPLRSDR